MSYFKNKAELKSIASKPGIHYKCKLLCIMRNKKWVQGLKYDFLSINIKPTRILSLRKRQDKLINFI